MTVHVLLNLLTVKLLQCRAGTNIEIYLQIFANKILILFFIIY